MDPTLMTAIVSASATALVAIVALLQNNSTLSSGELGKRVQRLEDKQ